MRTELNSCERRNGPADVSRPRTSALVARYSVLCVALSALLLPFGSPTQAQQPGKVPRIGMLFIGGRDQPHLESFKQGLRERGYIEGKNIRFEYRYAEGKEDRLDQLAAELVREKVDVIVTTASISALAARKASHSIPIVMTSGNPLEMGLAKSLAQPGGNVTGLTVMLSDLSSKRLEILKDTLPKMTRVAVLWTPQNRESSIGFDETAAAAKAFSLQLQTAPIQSANDLDQAFAEIAKAQVGGLAVILSPLCDAPLQTHCRARYQTPRGWDISDSPIRRGRRPDGIRSPDRRPLPARRCVCRQDLKRRQTGGSSSRATDEV